MNELEDEVRAALAAATRTAYAHMDGEEPWETIDLFVPVVARLIEAHRSARRPTTSESECLSCRRIALHGGWCDEHSRAEMEKALVRAETALGYAEKDVETEREAWRSAADRAQRAEAELVVVNRHRLDAIERAQKGEAAVARVRALCDGQHDLDCDAAGTGDDLDCEDFCLFGQILAALDGPTPP